MLSFALLAFAAPLPYLDPSLSWDARVSDLVGRLSLDEKATQLGNEAPAIFNAKGANLSAYHYWTECNSGIGVGYPQNINIAAAFNRSLVFETGRGTGTMLRAQYNARGTTVKNNRLSCWSPMMNIMRHPLWGRNHEGYGEDPFLSGEMAFANVRGLQGHGLPGYPHYSLAATGKAIQIICEDISIIIQTMYMIFGIV